MPLPHDEGGPEVKGTYRVIAQEPDVLANAVGAVRDAMRITVQEDFYGVTFSFAIPKEDWQGEGTKVAALDYTSYVQAIAGHEHVVGIQYGQEIDVTGNLQDVFFVTVRTSALDQTAVATVPFAKLNTPSAFALIDQAYTTLARTGGFTGG